MSAEVESPRTDPPEDPIDPHERFNAHVDEYVADRIESCSDCGSAELDAWITEGATSLYTVCASCGAERSEEI